MSRRRRRLIGGVLGPVNTVAPVVSGTETEGETLSCTEGTWTVTGTPSYAYQWRRGGANIGAATAATYELTGDDVDAMIDCRVTATDDNGSRGANSNSVGPIQAAAAAVPWSGYFAAAGVTNGTAQTAITAFADGLETDGIQSKIKVFVLLGAEAATAKNMMSDAYHGALVNSPTFTQWLGVRSDGATSYGSTGTALGSITGLTANSTMIGIGANQDAPANGNNYSGLNYLYAENSAPSYTASGVTPSFINASNEAEYTSYYPVNDGFGTPQTAAAAWGTLTDVRLYASRTGASAVAFYRGPTEVETSSESAVALPTEAMFIGAANFDGTPSWATNDETFDAKWYVIAEGLSGAEIALLDARIVTLITALEAL